MFYFKSKNAQKITSLLILFFTLLFSFDSLATTLTSKSPSQLVQQSGFILESEVLSKYSAFSDDKNTIYTFVSFTVRDVIKGKIDLPTIELRFEGGQVGDDILDVPGTPTFEIGEKGILFVKSTMDSNTQCPVAGWEKGKFVIKSEAGIEKMYDSRTNKILGYDELKDRFNISYKKSEDHINPIPIRNSPDVLVISKDAVEEKNAIAITKDQFKSIIKDIIKKQTRLSKGAVFKPLSAEEKFKSIQVLPATPEGNK